jgi:CRP-like cAMP-binding protein
MDVGKKVSANENIPAEMKPILTKAIALSPDDRYSWMEELIEDLREAVKKLALDLDPVALSAYMKQQFQRERGLDRRRMRRLLTEGFAPLRPEGKRRSGSSMRSGSQDTAATPRIIDRTDWPFIRDEHDLSAGDQLQPRIVVAKAGQVIYRQGDSGTDLYVIRSGKVRLFLKADRTKQTLAIIGAGDFFGETALLSDYRRPCWAQAEEESELACLPKEDFAGLVGTGLSVKIVGSLTERLTDVVNLLEGTLHKDVLTRLIHALLFICRRGYCSNGTKVGFAELKDAFQIDNDFLVQKYLNKLTDLGVLQANDVGILLKDVGKLESILNVLRGSGKLTLKL